MVFHCFNGYNFASLRNHGIIYYFLVPLCIHNWQCDSLSWLLSISWKVLLTDNINLSFLQGTPNGKENLLALPLMQRVELLLRPRTAHGGVIETHGHSKHAKSKRNTKSAKSERLRPTPHLQLSVCCVFVLIFLFVQKLH